MTIPFNLGYRMPAEWEKHEATWLSWPKDPDTFPKGIIEQVEQIYATMILALAQGERVNVLVDDKRMEKRVSSLLGNTTNVKFHRIKSVDVWMRDYGPIFVTNKDVAITKWIFNAWGNKYDDLLPDNDAGMQIAKSIGMNIFEPGIVLEGGSIDTNGQGVCITTEQCLLNKNRNPQLSKEQIECYMRDYLGFTDVIWLKEGVAGDDTDGHVDDIARFISEDTIVCMVEENPEDGNYDALKKNFELLKNTKFNIIPIQMPRRIDCPDRRLPASYANFYIGNAVVLVPIFNDKNDNKVIAVLEKAFPDKKIVGMNCEALVYGFGGIHCVTQQQPSRVVKK